MIVPDKFIAAHRVRIPYTARERKALPIVATCYLGCDKRPALGRRLYYHDSIEEVWAQYPDARFFYCSTHAAHRYDEVRFSDGDFLVFGKETAGLGEKILIPHADEAIRIPMGDGQRSLNLSNAVAIVVYEALRQNDFFGMR